MSNDSQNAISHYPAPGQCPICSHELTITRLDCDRCGSAIEGTFENSRFSRLSASQLRFIEAFVKNRGIIKEVEAELGISYPTVRGRLDDVIRTLGFNADVGDRSTPSDERHARREILEALQNKDISAAEASRRLAAFTQN
jgi:hypothetical protein